MDSKKGAVATDVVPKLQDLCSLMKDEPSTKLSCVAVSSSSMAVLTWLKEQGVVTTRTAAHAASNNLVGVLQHLHSLGCPWSMEVCREAAASGSLEALQWARENGCPWKADKIFIAAVLSGSIQLAQWVGQQPGVIRHSDSVATAAECGHAALCAFLLQQQFPVTRIACMYAAKGGHTDALRTLRENGCPWNDFRVRRAAATKGSVAVLEYVQQQGILVTAA
jgi:hypothetical protein